MLLGMIPKVLLAYALIIITFIFQMKFQIVVLAVTYTAPNTGQTYERSQLTSALLDVMLPFTGITVAQYTKHN